MTHPRYNPWWMPTALAFLLLLCVVLVGFLVASRVSHQQTPAVSETAGGAPSSQQVYQWTLVTTWPKKFPGLGLAPENFAELVKRMSNGRLLITVYGANQIVPALGVFGAVESGSAQMGHGAAYYWKGKISAAPFFTAIPFGMNAKEFNGWLHYGSGLALWRELYAPFNIIPFAAGNTGVQMGGWFNKEINSMKDLSGLKMRIPGLAGEVLTRAGGTAVNIPGGELYTALQSGVIDAAEWVGPYNDLAFGFHQIAKYYYYPGWHEPGPGLELIVNKTAFESLPADLQAIIEVAARAINQDMLDEYTTRDASALVELQLHHRVDVRPFPPEVLQQLKQYTQEILQETAAKDAQFAKVYQSYKTYLEASRAMHALTEEHYYKAR
jgi:TRAP-type mannitol/chloroaromatic compound transport system substrate-binding protein